MRALVPDADHPGLQPHVDAQLRERVADGGDDVTRPAWHELVHYLDYRDCCAHLSKCSRHLNADHAAADYRQRLGERGQPEYLVGADYAARVEPHPGQVHGARSRCDDDCLGVQELAAGSDLDGRGGPEAGRPGDQVDIVGLEEELDRPPESVHDGPVPCGGLWVVDAQLWGGYAHARALADVLQGLCDREERLHRDAAPVQACAAEQILLHERHAPAQLGEADCGDVSAGAPSYDDCVI